MQARRILLLMIAAAVATTPPVYADKPEDKGKDHAPGQERREEKQEQRAERAEARAEAKAERAAEAATTRAADRRDASSSADTRQERQTQERIEREMRQHDPERGQEQEHVQVANLVDSLNRLDHARWSHNPHDTRGQGNLGRPAMQDPFGFDKDSGREGRDHGRPIQESEPAAAPSLNLEGLVSAELNDPYFSYLQDMVAWAQNLLSWASANPTSAYAAWMTSYASSTLTYYRDQLARYQSTPQSTYQAILYYGDPVEYSLTLQPIEGMDTGNWLVTTQLVSAETVSVTGWTGDWQPFSATYETGQVLVEQQQALTLNQNGTYTFNLDPSAALLGGGFFNGSEGVTVDVVVTLTDPASGSSYSMTLDQPIRLVDPYGIIYDKATGKPIANATVTVHHLNGSVVALDRSGNANARNPQSTDATGRYSCKLPPGKYYLTVDAPGYQDYKSPLFSEQGHIVREDVGLARVRTSVPVDARTADRAVSPAISPAIRSAH